MKIVERFCTQPRRGRDYKPCTDFCVNNGCPLHGCFPLAVMMDHGADGVSCRPDPVKVIVEGRPPAEDGVRILAETDKAPLWLLQIPALKQVARAMEQGNRQADRGPFNWRRQHVLRSDMVSGAHRHLLDAENGLDADADSGQDPIAHAIARLLILLDAKEHGTLVDTRVLRKAAE